MCVCMCPNCSYADMVCLWHVNMLEQFGILCGHAMCSTGGREGIQTKGLYYSMPIAADTNHAGAQWLSHGVDTFASTFPFPSAQI